MLAAITGFTCDAIALLVRDQPLQRTFSDSSILITAALLSFCMPPLAPWWLVVSAAAFATVLAKHMYGGSGKHLFNPAMIGYVVLLISFPAQMTQWLPAAPLVATPLTFTDTLHSILTGHWPSTLEVNLLSSASPLTALQSGLTLRYTMDEIFASPVFGNLAGTGWEWVSLCALLGGITLLTLRIIRWHIPVAMLGSIALCAAVMNITDPGRYAGVIFHLLSGATMLGAFYIATDPVTAPRSHCGRLIYGAGIGVLTYVIRSESYYHDGVAFAVLTMNMLAPLIDKFTTSQTHDEVR